MMTTELRIYEAWRTGEVIAFIDYNGKVEIGIITDVILSDYDITPVFDKDMLFYYESRTV